MDRNGNPLFSKSDEAASPSPIIRVDHSINSIIGAPLEKYLWKLRNNWRNHLITSINSNRNVWYTGIPSLDKHVRNYLMIHPIVVFVYVPSCRTRFFVRTPTMRIEGWCVFIRIPSTGVISDGFETFTYFFDSTNEYFDLGFFCLYDDS